MTTVRYTWDGAKRLRNLSKHGVDFADAARVFDGPTVTAEDDRAPYGERRFQTLGVLDQFIVTIVHTERHGATRIISMRKATRHETRSFFAQITD
ncbi:MAG: BrnT family toxin [Gammaproteobacteria bacterium]